MSQCAVCLVRSPGKCIQSLHRQWEKRRGLTQSFLKWIGHDDGSVSIEIGATNPSLTCRVYNTEKLI